MSNYIIRKFKFPDYVGMSNAQLEASVVKIQDQLVEFDEKEEAKKDYTAAMFKAGALSLKSHYCFSELFKRHGITKEEVAALVEKGVRKNLLKTIHKN